MGRGFALVPAMRQSRGHLLREADLCPLDDARAVNCRDNPCDGSEYPSCTDRKVRVEPAEAASNDPEVLRAALLREHGERRRAECLRDMQTEVVKLALDLLVREPDIEGFFGALTKKMVEESESHACGVWLIDDGGERCDALDGAT